jgi:hypothetical protein
MSLSEQVAALEQENISLSNLVDTMGEELEKLKKNPPVGEKEKLKDRLIELVAPDIERLAPYKDTIIEKNARILRAYLELFPEKGEWWHVGRD